VTWRGITARLQMFRLVLYPPVLLLALKSVIECNVLTWSKETVIQTSWHVLKRRTGMRARGQSIAEAGMTSGG